MSWLPHIVETKASHFEPKRFEDQYEEALKDYSRAQEEYELRRAAWKEQFKANSKKGKAAPDRPEDEPEEPELLKSRVRLNVEADEEEPEQRQDAGGERRQPPLQRAVGKARERRPPECRAAAVGCAYRC